jgi:hypothetical protein
VRTSQLAVVVSTVLHVAALAWISTCEPAARSADAARTLTPIEIIERPPERAAAATDPAALEVALLADPASAAPPAIRAPAPRAAPEIATAVTAPASPAPGAPPSTSAAITTAPAGRGSADPVAAPHPDRRSLLAMRTGDPPRIALPAGRWDDLDHVPSGTRPAKDPTTGMLEPSGGGQQRSDQGVFVATVDPDGTVAISDSPNLHVHLALPSAKAIGNGVSRWYASDKGRFGEQADPALAQHVQVTSGAPTDQPDSLTTRVKDRAPTAVVPVISGGFDVTDWLMRRSGGDPYASRKLAMLDATRDERVETGGKYRAEQLRRSTQIMQRNLEALWARTRDPRARKQALFELWDECAETGDPALVEAAQAARRMVIGFVRARLPAGSPDAFTPGELAGFARSQQSKAAFAPYE